MNHTEIDETLQSAIKGDAVFGHALKASSKPGQFTERVNEKNTGETAYQRAIILAKKSNLKGIGHIHWLDIELPVSFGATSRRKCLDLIGRSNEKGMVLCELKYEKKQINPNSRAKPDADSPVYATLELLQYYLFIRENASALQRQKIWHANNRGNWNWTDCTKPKNVTLIVAANSTYWDKWKNHAIWEEQATKITQINSKLAPHVHVHFYRTPNPDRSLVGQAKDATPDSSNKTDKHGKMIKTYQPELGQSARIKWEKIGF